MSDARKKLIEKVSRYVEANFAGNWMEAFNGYDKDGDGRINADEAHRFLSDAGEGNWWVREIAVRQMIRAGDLNADGKLSFVEFLALIGSNGNGGEHTGENDVP